MGRGLPLKKGAGKGTTTFEVVFSHAEGGAQQPLEEGDMKTLSSGVWGRGAKTTMDSQFSHFLFSLNPCLK